MWGVVYFIFIFLFCVFAFPLSPNLDQLFIIPCSLFLRRRCFRQRPEQAANSAHSLAGHSLPTNPVGLSKVDSGQVTGWRVGGRQSVVDRLMVFFLGSGDEENPACPRTWIPGHLAACASITVVTPRAENYPSVLTRSTVALSRRTVAL